jgi:hypothetical protein
MNTHSGTVGTPTQTSFYDQQMSGLHIDGIFFAMLWFWSWVLFIWLWAWNHKPRKSKKLGPMPSKWEVPSDNWRN